jgi:uncharacterized protein with WD repeat
LQTPIAIKALLDDATLLLLLHSVPAAAKKIPIKGVTTFQPCPAPGKQLLAAFIAESKGQPAVATVVDCSGDAPVTISRKSFYRATGVQWQELYSVVVLLQVF